MASGKTGSPSKYDEWMDGETTRLFVTALLAVVAGLGGALIAGAFNSENTRTAIYAARQSAQEQREAERQSEHDRWLRDRKVDAYTKYLADVHELELIIAEIRVGLKKDTGQVLEKARALSLLSLRVLAPRLVNEAAGEVVTSIKNIIKVMPETLASGHSEYQPYETAVDDFNSNVTLLELRIAKDLGIDWSA